MVAVFSWALLAVSAPGEVELLEFTSAHCGPCRMMAPVVAKLQQIGYPIRQIDVQQNPRLAARYGVRGVPAFILTAAGREVDRVEGAVSPDKLVRMLTEAGFQPGRSEAPAPAAPAGPRLATKTVPAHLRGGGMERRVPTNAYQAKDGPTVQTVSATQPAGPRRDPVERAMAATVRFKVEDPQGFSYGTGSIIDVHGDEALVLTCAHIFRDSGGRGAIQVDLFPQGRPVSTTGRLLVQDAESDVALVVMKPGVSVEAVRIASQAGGVRPGENVFSVGCERGQQPTVLRGRVTSRTYSSPLIEVTGQPIDGRSGGGLYNALGQLIGVCNFANPQDKTGLYAATKVVHALLDERDLGHVYAETSPADVVADAAPARPTMPAEMPRMDSATPSPSSPLAFANSAREVIVVVPEQDGAARVIRVANPSPEFLGAVAREGQEQPQAVPTRQRVPKESSLNDGGWSALR